ncbi:hypothetical protein KUTeg_011903 [Tegillarca granosa]|uniref:Golgin-45 n=1 Tax=Tegillarca granosa TaxID=220873 RepID=A0ABQ9EY10_TEGGR|nr:hypothetical protein KUTeg_011903 [Tegillarca granosa]
MATTEKHITAFPKEKIAALSNETQNKKANIKNLTLKSELEENHGTVLLRHPLPKYSFQVSTKKHSNKKDNSSSNVNGSKKTETVTASVAPNVRSDPKLFSTPSALEKPVSKVDPLQNSNVKTASNTGTADSSVNNAHSKVTTNVTAISPQTGDHQNVEGQYESLPFPEVSSPCNRVGSCSHEEQVKKLTEELSDLKNQLDVQVKVNGELKKLLVASVGDDLHSKVERLARDRAQMALELGDFTKKMMEDYENLDKVAIQADMWRSKYLASRVMADELASAKAFFAMQLQESQHAIQQMLTERHELRTNLIETYRCLNQVKSAFDPLNSQRSSALQSSNSIELAKMNKQLTEAIRYRLLPSTVPLQTCINMDVFLDNTFTKAELYAQELLSKKIHLEESVHLADPGSSVIERYHPYTNFENLTFNCCPHCKGEITAL